MGIMGPLPPVLSPELYEHVHTLGVAPKRGNICEWYVELLVHATVKRSLMTLNVVNSGRLCAPC